MRTFYVTQCDGQIEEMIAVEIDNGQSWAIPANRIAEEAAAMLDELNEHRQEVTLIPARDPKFVGHKVRHVVSQNAPWYRDYYNARTHIKRQLVAKALEKIATGTNCNAFDCRPMTEIIIRRLFEGFETPTGERIPAEYGPNRDPDFWEDTAPTTTTQNALDTAAAAIWGDNVPF